MNYLDLELEQDDSQEFITNNIDNAYYNGVSINDYYIYYELFENELGLTNHMRTRSLTDCYKSQWWKTTQKNNLSWNNIHRFINNPLTIKIYYKKFRYGWSYEEFFTELFDMPHNFRDPTIRERHEILKSYYELFLFNEINESNSRDSSFIKVLSKSINNLIFLDSSLFIVF